ncbi:MAG: NAD(P)/FAD-dependent oxidoreductase [Candidatus Heimdallarchaeota archaeon]
MGVDEVFDVLIVGGGPAGTATAISTLKNIDLRVVIIEKKSKHYRKPCGGLLTPICKELFEDTLQIEIPDSVFSNPPTLGLYYVPPSGWKAGGAVPNYQLLNIERDRFDSWLLNQSAKEGAEVLEHTRYLGFEADPSSYLVKLRKGDEIISVKTKVIIAADGCRSSIRRAIFPERNETITVMQQKYDAERCNLVMDPFFYVFYGKKFTDIYAYLIFKEHDKVLVGTAAFTPIEKKSSKGLFLKQFRRIFLNFLSETQNVTFSLPESVESWPIPFFPPVFGRGEVLLVGDAGGFCNSFTGEGIRFALECGITAGECIAKWFARADNSLRTLAKMYEIELESLEAYIRKMQVFTRELTDQTLEGLVRDSLKKRWN